VAWLDNDGQRSRKMLKKITSGTKGAKWPLWRISEYLQEIVHRSKPSRASMPLEIREKTSGMVANSNTFAD
jgi:hypothetical protein